MSPKMLSKCCKQYSHVIHCSCKRHRLSEWYTVAHVVSCRHARLASSMPPDTQYDHYITRKNTQRHAPLPACRRPSGSLCQASDPGSAQHTAAHSASCTAPRMGIRCATPPVQHTCSHWWCQGLHVDDLCNNHNKRSGIYLLHIHMQQCQQDAVTSGRRVNSLREQ